MSLNRHDDATHHAVHAQALIIGVLAGDLPGCEALTADQLSLPVDAQHLTMLDASELMEAIGFDEVQLQQRAFGALLGSAHAPEFRASLGDMLNRYADQVGAAMAQREFNELALDALYHSKEAA